MDEAEEVAGVCVHVGEDAKGAAGAKFRGDEGDEIRQGGKLGNSVANETAGTSLNTTDLEPGKSSNSYE